MNEAVNVCTLYAALDSKRKGLELSWRQVAKEVGVNPSTLSRIGNGFRPDVDAFAKLVRWVGLPAEAFFVGDDSTPSSTDLLSELAPLLRARKDLSERDVAYLEDIIGAAVRRFKAEREET